MAGSRELHMMPWEDTDGRIIEGPYGGPIECDTCPCAPPACCTGLTCHDLLDDIVPPGKTLGTWTRLYPKVVPNPDTPPVSGWRRDRSSTGTCARFVCMSVTYTGLPADEWTIQSTVYCGPTSNNLDLPGLILSYIEHYGDPDFWRETRCLVFKVEFWAWCQETTRPGNNHPTQYVVQPSDTKYRISYAPLTANL